MSRIFWDTNLFIYLIEDCGKLSDRVAAIREHMTERGDQLLTSSLTLGEILVKPIEAARDDLRLAYERALRSAALIVPFDDGAAVAYAQVRQDRAIRPPDAIQLACAARAGCDLFITNDERLSRKRVKNIEFITSLSSAPL